MNRTAWLASDENPDPEVRAAWRAKLARRSAGQPDPQFPPLAQQLATAAGAVIRLGIQWLTGGPLLVSPEKLDSRLAICQPCEKWSGSRCTACGCFGQLKARLESETGQCPLGKW